MSSAVSFPFHDNCTAIPIYLYTYYLCMYFVFQCSLVVVTVEWYDSRIIGDFRFFYVPYVWFVNWKIQVIIAAMCKIKNQTLWMEFYFEPIFEIHFWNILILLGHTSKYDLKNYGNHYFWWKIHACLQTTQNCKVV